MFPLHIAPRLSFACDAPGAINQRKVIARTRIEMPRWKSTLTETPSKPRRGLTWDCKVVQSVLGCLTLYRLCPGRICALCALLCWCVQKFPALNANCGLELGFGQRRPCKGKQTAFSWYPKPGDLKTDFPKCPVHSVFFIGCRATGSFKHF